jgi:hypothetical protein
MLFLVLGRVKRGVDAVLFFRGPACTVSAVF